MGLKAWETQRAVGSLRQDAGRLAAHFRNRGVSGARAVAGAAITPPPTAASAAASGSASGQPAWARRFRQTQAMREGALVAVHTLGAGDGGGASEGPNLKQRE